MSSWWNSTGASNLTRGLSSITGQISNNLKDILTEASEENYDPTTELTRARQQIEDLEIRKQALTEEVEMFFFQLNKNIFFYLVYIIEKTM